MRVVLFFELSYHKQLEFHSGLIASGERGKIAQKYGCFGVVLAFLQSAPSTTN